MVNIIQKMIIRKLANDLSIKLACSYGKNDFYTKKQVDNSLQRGRWFYRYMCEVSQVMFCKQSDIDISQQRYVELRQVIAKSLFEKNVDFTAKTLRSFAKLSGMQDTNFKPSTTSSENYSDTSDSGD
ncbi:hypothetical protein DS2_01888 [Catenovulum agarivorans DS-2]|uniref:Uncharacterized protein n=1 Tax=Catenovulum agarivorans DS-2 TaxID=1328313 RepID=W7QSA6_9ALTE|nr:DUF6559 family protein [Catenovulum agarivorans]EWH11897.1 hypothetical protein DS2_01888 [Catenovulum agarivorans DS-2]